MAFLVVNAGSTSLKLHLVQGDESRRVASWDQVPGQVRAVAHRVVHGGERFREPVLLDDAACAALRELVPLAPLHNAPGVRAIDEARRALPDVPHVAVFDTAFHATIPAEAATYAVPAAWEVRRYGFHGLSVQWAAERVRVPRLVVCHLGGGSSVTAVLDGRSVDTTMGFTPLEGVPMTTRSGSVDPGALVYVLRRLGLDADALDHALNFESGLKALGGGSGDMREVEAAGGGPALEVYVHHVAAAVAAMTASLNGLDALVFTAGIGERSALVRARVCARLAHLGVELDERANGDAAPDCTISRGAVDVHVVVAREELVAARAAEALLS